MNRTLATLLLTSCLPFLSAPLQASSNWPTYHGDAGLRGVAETTLPETLVTGWRFKAGSPVSHPPIVGKGVIYAVTDRSEIIALGMDGTKRWMVSLPQTPQKTDGTTNKISRPQQELISTPLLWVSNTLVAGTDKGFIYAFNTDTGTVLWKTQIGDDTYGALSWMEPEGTNGFSILALSRNNGSLCRLELTTGRIMWASKPEGRSDGSPAIGTDCIVFGACDSALHFISPCSGTTLEKTRLEEHGPMAGGVAIDGSRVYGGTRDGSVFCADTTTGQLLWINQVSGNEIFTTPAITTNRVLVGSSDEAVYCLNRSDGKKIWSAPTQGNPSSPVIAGNKVVVTSGGALLLLSLADGKTLWSDKPCDMLSSPAITAGKIIAGTDDGFIILYQPK